MRSSSDLAKRAWDSSPLSKPLFGSLQSSSKIPCGRRICPDATPRKEKLNCHTTLSTSLNIPGMIGHRHKTIPVIETFPLLLPKSKVKVLVAVVLRSHLSQFLRSSVFLMVPNFLNQCVIPQALVGQIDNQKRFREYSHPLVHFAAFSIRG